MPAFAGFVGSGARPLSPEDRKAVLSEMGARLGRPSGMHLREDLALVAATGPGETSPVDAAEALFVLDRPLRAEPPAPPPPHGPPRLLDAYLDALDGAFAAVAWDRLERRLLLARGAPGQRSLYYHHRPGLLVFGSEPWALLAHPDCPRGIDWRGAADPVDVRATPFRGVQALCAGERATFGPDLRITPATVEDRPDTEAFEDRLAAWVDRLADSGPIAVSLEGGAAAAVLLALATRGRPRGHEPLWLLDPVGRGVRLDGFRKLAERLRGSPARTADDLQLPEGMSVDLERLERLVRTAGEPFLGARSILRAEAHRRLGESGGALEAWSASGAPRLHLGPESVDDVPSEPPPSSRRVTDAALARAGVPRSFRAFTAEAFRPGWEESPGGDHESEMRLRHREATREALAETRMAEAQGIALRVPFLDPSIVEAALRAARLPAPRRRGIPAAAAQAWLPAEAGPLLAELDRPTDDDFETRVGRRILDMALPAFLESYCSAPDSMFSADRMRQAHQVVARARRGSPLGARFVEWLLKGATAAIFARMVTSPSSRSAV